VPACAMSRDREVLLLVTEEGFTTTSSALNGVRMAQLPWPVAPCKLDKVYVANGGESVAFADNRLGVWVGTVAAGETAWTRLHPSERLIGETRKELKDPEHQWNGSMTHCALSPDGRFIGYGSQDHGHYLDMLGGDGTAKRWATIGHRSEYPHDACFSDDGRFAAFNSCHFYSGVTVGVVVPEIEGAETAPYREDDRVRQLNPYLRVYASTWLPADAIGVEPGGFVLCGLGFATCVTPEGRVVFEQYFGSSASAVDYCPRTRRMIISSYAGFLHVYDIDALELHGRAIGFNPRRELYRWILWKDCRPMRW
jgi:hypothetical protein